MRVSWKSQCHGISFVQVCNESMAAARERRSQDPEELKKKILQEEILPCLKL